MREYVYHPDGVCYLRADGLTYSDTPANADLDAGFALPRPGPGATSLTYVPGDGARQFGPEGLLSFDPTPLADVDALLADVAGALARQQARQPVPPPPPTPAEILDANRTQAEADILTGREPVHISARGADAAVWTYGVNHLLECFTARFALAAAGNWTPTADQVAAQIAAARLTPAGVVDADAPPPDDVAALMMSRGRLDEATIVGRTQALVGAGGGDPLPGG